MNYLFDEKTPTPLCEIMDRRGSDKGSVKTSWHNYSRVYYSIFKDIRKNPMRIFEIGIGTSNPNMPFNTGPNAHIGASLYAWREFFENSEIFAADIDMNVLISDDKISTFFCDQTNPKIIQDMWTNEKLSEGFDIIIDDGYHSFAANSCFFENSIHKLNPNGYFIIEDINSSELSLFREKINEWEKKYPKLLFTLNCIPSTVNFVDNNMLIIREATAALGVPPKRPAANVHIVMYSDGEPFDTTKKLTLDTVKSCSNKNVIIHDFNLERIKTRPWFEKIKDLPLIQKIGYRDGYYCAYKAFCSWEVYQTLGDDDVMFYLDSSQYYRDGFTENIDRLCDIACDKGFVAGSVGDDYTNACYDLCGKLNVWKKILPECDETILNKRHILSSWFILKKNDINTRFMDDWIEWCTYTDEDFPEPLITQHYTGDQSIFNMLVHKYKFQVFYYRHRYHCMNKDKNGVLRTINTCLNVDNLFITL